MRDALKDIAPALEGDVHTAILRVQLALSLERLNQLSEAERHWRLAVESADRSGQVDLVLGWRRPLAFLHERQGRLDEAEQVWRERLAKAKREYAGDRRAIGLTQMDLARFLRERGGVLELAEAETLAAEAAANLTATVGPGHLDTLRSRRQHALAVRQLGRSEQAERLLIHAIQDAERANGAQHWMSYWLRTARGFCLTDLQRLPEAEVELCAGHAGLEATLEPGNAAIGTARDALVALYEAWSRPEQAAAFRGE
ncbi:MAG: hypothetical protein DRQ55_17840 [Planctomycetota bacterium]|nr:MAG: hypothetical protein DRQ55_17840 [Planctomycetota bacterium]